MTVLSSVWTLNNDNDNDNEIILFGHREKNSKMLNIVDTSIMLIMLVIDILVCPGDLISAL